MGGLLDLPIFYNQFPDIAPKAPDGGDLSPSVAAQHSTNQGLFSWSC